MKKTIALSVAALMVLGMVALTGTIFADTHTSQITAFINRGISMTWDGKAFEPKENDGSRLYPIVYEGRTYLPAKMVADQAGIDVDWDANTQTVVFKSRVIDIDITTPYKDAENAADAITSDALANLPFYRFHLEIEGDDDDNELEVDFKLYAGRSYEAEVEIELDDQKELELNGERALNYLLPIFEDLNINAAMSQKEIIDEVIRAFNWQYGSEEFELEVYFNNGTRIDIDFED